MGKSFTCCYCQGVIIFPVPGGIEATLLGVLSESTLSPVQSWWLHISSNLAHRLEGNGVLKAELRVRAGDSKGWGDRAAFVLLFAQP